MGKYTRKKQNNRNGLILTIAALSVLLIVLLLVVFLNGGEDGNPTVPTRTTPIKTLTIENVEERGRNVVISTTYGQFVYPYAFVDLIQTEAENHGNWSVLHFYLSMNGQRSLVYSIGFNSGAGDVVGMANLDEIWTDTPITVTFAQLPAGADEELTTTFYAVQETFNDVLASMKENENMLIGP